MNHFTFKRPFRHEAAAFARFHEFDLAVARACHALERWENEGGKINFPSAKTQTPGPMAYAREIRRDA